LNISGVILAGGTNRRFKGITKAKIVIEGKSIISRIIDTIRDVFDEIIIVTNTPEVFKEFNNCKLVPDHFKMAGPLGGIHAALKTASGDAVFVFAGDMALLNKELIVKQITYYSNNKTDALIPRIVSNIEPLHAIYSTDILIILEDYLTKGNDYAVWKFLKLINVGFLQVEDSKVNKLAFTNINTPSDLARVQKLLGLP